MLQEKWYRLAQAGELAEAVVEYVRLHDSVTFAELYQRFKHFTTVSGAFSLELTAVNYVLWGGMSEDWSRLIGSLIESKRLHCHPTVFLSYAYDGMILQMPIVNRPPKRGYTTPHWCPVFLRLAPLEQPHRSKRPAGARTA